MFPTISFNIERWKWNAEYEIYVSTEGRFRDIGSKELKIMTANSGYMKVKLPNGKLRSAHRLVIETWKPVENSEHLTVDHLDHNKRNNKLSNLEWVTEEENLRRAKEDHAGGNCKSLRDKVFVINGVRLSGHEAYQVMGSASEKEDAWISNLWQKATKGTKHMYCGKKVKVIE